MSSNGLQRKAPKRYLARPRPMPPMAMLIGFLWLGEVPTLFGLIGGVMALAGVVVVNLKR